MIVDALLAIERARLVPVIEIDDPFLAADLGRTLIAGGLPLAEITFRTTHAAAAIARLRDSTPELHVGAGTVLTPQQVDTAARSGASFVVTPGLNPATIERALERGIAVIPGVCTPTEIELAMRLGVSTLKFFPAMTSGGTAFLQAVSSVYQDVRFVPTGGISQENLATYLSLRNVIACAGTWIAPRALLAERAFGRIEDIVRAAVAIADDAPRPDAGR